MRVWVCLCARLLSKYARWHKRRKCIPASAPWWGLKAVTAEAWAFSLYIWIKILLPLTDAEGTRCVFTLCIHAQLQKRVWCSESKCSRFCRKHSRNRLERSRFRLCLRAEAFTVDGNLCQSRGFFKLFYSLDGLQYDCRRQNQTFWDEQRHASAVPAQRMRQSKELRNAR